VPSNPQAEDAGVFWGWLREQLFSDDNTHYATHMLFLRVFGQFVPFEENNPYREHMLQIYGIAKEKITTN